MSRASGRWTGSEKDESQKIKNKKGKIGVLLLFSEPRHATHFRTFVTATAGIQTPSWNAVKNVSWPAERKNGPCIHFRSFPSENDHRLTRRAVLLVRSILAVLLPITSPWQRHTLVGGSPTVEFLWGARLFACGPEMKEMGRLLQRFYGHTKAAAATKKHLQDTLGLDFYRPHNAVKTHPILHHSGQLILLSGLPLQRHAERSWNTANAQSAVKQKNHSAPPPLFFLPICSSWHRVGLIQITLRFIWSTLLIIHVCLQCSLKQPRMTSKGTRQILYLFLDDFIHSDYI